MEAVRFRYPPSSTYLGRGETGREGHGLGAGEGVGDGDVDWACAPGVVMIRRGRCCSACRKRWMSGGARGTAMDDDRRRATAGAVAGASAAAATTTAGGGSKWGGGTIERSGVLRWNDLRLSARRRSCRDLLGLRESSLMVGGDAADCALDVRCFWCWWRWWWCPVRGIRLSSNRMFALSSTSSQSAVNLAKKSWKVSGKSERLDSLGIVASGHRRTVLLDMARRWPKSPLAISTWGLKETWWWCVSWRRGRTHEAIPQFPLAAHLHLVAARWRTSERAALRLSSVQCRASTAGAPAAPA